MHPFLTLLCALSLNLVLHTTTAAQDLSGRANAPLDTAPTFGSSAFDTGAVSFLPVEQAFQLTPQLQSGVLQLIWDIAPNYYLYKHQFKVSVTAAGKTTDLPLHLPTPGIARYDEIFEKELEVFYRSAELVAELPKGADQLQVRVQSQGCADAGLCYPPQHQHYAIDLSQQLLQPLSPADAQGGIQPQSLPPTTTGTPAFLPYILLLAILGGTILNLMPCVFPVLSIKALSMAGAHQSNHRQHLHGWMYTVGAMATFVLVAALMLAARAGGQAVGWGFQLQSPVLVSLLAYLFFAMGLSLSGLVTFGVKLMGVGQSLTGSKGLRNSFFTGALATVVASPCTAPFMGTALGYALTQPAAVSLAIFAALGFGMALPFLLLSYVPQLGKYLPKPGPWMETLRQCLAFPLYLTAIWLLWVLGRQTGSDSVALVCIGGVLIAFAFWLSHHGAGNRWIRNTLVVTSMLAALTIPFGLHSLSKPAAEVQTATTRWQAYTPEHLRQLRAEGQAVFVNLTADWCLTCLANERLALHTEAVETAFDQHGIVTLKGDWTNYNADITQLLNEYGRSGVPLYLMFPANAFSRAQVLPQLLTQESLIKAMKKAVSVENNNKAGTLAAKN